MSDYRRFVSYIYSYPGGEKDKNVGFIKAEVRDGQFKLSISLKGVYTNVPETFGVYLMVDKDENVDGRFTLIKIGNIQVSSGIGEFHDILNPQNIENTLYSFDDIAGIAIANPGDQYYMMFSMWEDTEVNPAAVNFAPDNYQKGMRIGNREQQEDGVPELEPGPVIIPEDRENEPGPVIEPDDRDEIPEMEPGPEIKPEDRELEPGPEMMPDYRRGMQPGMQPEMEPGPVIMPEDGTDRDDSVDMYEAKKVDRNKNKEDLTLDSDGDSELLGYLTSGDSEIIDKPDPSEFKSTIPKVDENVNYVGRYDETIDDTEQVFEKLNSDKGTPYDNMTEEQLRRKYEALQYEDSDEAEEYVRAAGADQSDANKNVNSTQQNTMNRQQMQQMRMQQMRQQQQMRREQMLRQQQAVMQQRQAQRQQVTNQQMQRQQSSNQQMQGQQSYNQRMNGRAPVPAPTPKNGFEAAFENAEFIDAFDDDYFYDCVEVSPDVLRAFPVEDESIINNSFLIHGFYNYKHVLFGRVRENDNNTKYFLGVPGMYCNRERFMASMFGFNNFKKSHRSDYTNPYFGYWYQEL